MSRVSVVNASMAMGQLPFNPVTNLSTRDSRSSASSLTYSSASYNSRINWPHVVMRRRSGHDGVYRWSVAHLA